MEQPWGLSGPEFLLLYGMGLIVWCAIVVVARAVVKDMGKPVGETGGLGLYERAYLHGGSDRVADTALAGLIHDGRVRVSRSRKLHRVSTQGEDDEVQREVLALAGSEGTISEPRKAIRLSGHCDTLRRRLVEEGFLVPSGAHAVLRLLVWGFPILALIAVVRGVNGVRLGYPVGFLFFEFAVTLLLWGGAAHKCGHPLRTKAGDAVGKPSSTAVGSGHAVVGPLVGGAAAELVAFAGLSAYPDPTVVRLLNTSSSGGAASGVSSSCGGGGGGGCGGGGGG
ncbi:TIGR04222 domain-containing membrane protein [Saccharopolyspora tripterygii]